MSDPILADDTTGEVLHLLRVQDVARALGVSCVTIRAWERTGRIRGLRLGGLLRFHAAAVRALVEEAETAPRRVPPPELLAAGGRPRGRRRRR